MHAGAGGRVADSLKSITKGRLLAGVSAAALAFWLPSAALAANYTAGTEQELRDAIAAANLSPDASSTITLTGSFTVAGGALPATPGKSLTVDTQGFILSGTTAAGVNFTGNFPSGTLAIAGQIAGAAGGTGLVINSGITSVGSPTGQVVNNGSITGGAAGSGGLGVSLLNVVTFVNNGMVSGGTGAGGGLGNNMAGVNINSTGATVINNASGVIQGGNATASGHVGAGVFVTTTGKVASITNFGIIRGGADLSGLGHGEAAIRGRGGISVPLTINNLGTGILEGGNGAAAIANDGNFPWAVELTNSGTIRAGAGSDNAISMAQNVGNKLTVELQAGSQIIGNVVASATRVDDILRLGGNTDSSFDVSTIGAAAQYRNFDSFQKTGASIWTLTGETTQVTPWHLESGTLSIASDASLGAVSGGLIIEGGTLQNTASFTSARNITISSGGTFQTDADLTLSGSISGSAPWQKTGSANLILTGNSSAFAGPVAVLSGALLVNGSLASPLLSAQPGATLGGSGAIIGNVFMLATLAPGGAGNAPGTLTITGDAILLPGSQLAYNLGQAGVPGGPLNDLLIVNGNLALDATLNVTTSAGGSFDPGVYRIINYTGTLSGGGLTVGSVPTPDFSLQTGIPGQINLINTAGMSVNFWDGGTDGRANNTIGGGDGDWHPGLGNDNWTNEAGIFNSNYSAGAFAVFQGAPGTVTVDPAGVVSGGMQFVTSGYTIQGGDITLTGPQAVIRVGDGTTAGVNIDARIDSNLVGSAQLVKSDLGWLTVTGTNTYTGGTVIAAGTLAVGNGGTSGSILGDVVNDGALIFVRSDAVTFDGTISGSGRVTQGGSGTLTLTGINTYTGSTGIAGGGTLIGSATSFGSGGILNLGALVIDQPSDAVFANPIIGNGSLAKRGGGNLNLTGDSSGLTGPTTIGAGKLSVNGSLANSAVTVLSGAVLGGTGTVGATTVQSGGTIAPGNSIGTLNVNGNLVLAPGSTYEVEIAGNGTSDRIAVTGIATVTGSQVGVTALDPQTSYITGRHYTIITAAGGVTGTAPAAVSRSAFLDLSIDQQPNQVDLVIAVKGVPPVTPPVTPPTDPGTPPTDPGTPSDPGTPPVTPPATPPVTPPAPPPLVFQTVAQTANQYATALALNTLPQVGGTLALYNSLLMLDAPSALAAFDALSGDAHASAKTALVEESWLLRNAMNDRLRSAFGSVGATPMATMNYGFTADLAPAVKGPMPKLAPTERFAVWGQGYGAWGRTDSDRNAAKLTRSTGGFLVGADIAAFDTMRFGVIAGYSRSDFDVKGRLSSGESDNYHLGLYGGGPWGALSLRTGASYTWHEIETSRIVAFPGFGNSLRADYNAGTAQVFGEFGYRFDVGQVALEPFAGLAYVNLHTDGFNEIGGAAALSGRSDDTSLGYSTLGLRASTSFAMQGMDLTLRGGLAWRHAFGDVDPTATLAFAGSSAFTVAGLPIARDAALVEAGLDLAISRSATLGVSYTGQLAQDAQDHAFKANLAVRF